MSRSRAEALKAFYDVCNEIFPKECFYTEAELEYLRSNFEFIRSNEDEEQRGNQSNNININ